jgi:hypothetical protein
MGSGAQSAKPNASLRNCRTVKKAITHLKLNQANPGKLQKLDELAAEHQRVVQAYVDWLICNEVRQPNKYADMPEEEVPTARARNAAGSSIQYSNGEQPVYRTFASGQHHVVVIEPLLAPF